MFARALVVLLTFLAAAPQIAAAEQAIVDDPALSGDPAFVTHVTGAGWENDLFRTIAEGQGNPEVNGATWTASGLSAGTYQVDVWIPSAHAKNIVRYFVAHAGGETEVRLNQSKFGNNWVRLGIFEIAGPNATLRSTDAGGFAGEELAWDAARWTKIETPPPPPDPTADEQIVDDPQLFGPPEFLTTFVGVGYDSDLTRTYAEGELNADRNSAEWKTTLTPGKWEVAVYVPSEHAGTIVEYVVGHAGGSTVVPVDQGKFNDTWVTLGTFDLDKPEAVVRSGDGSGQFGEEIAWDAVRWKRVKPPEPTPDPAPPQQEQVPVSNDEQTPQQNVERQPQGPPQTPRDRDEDGVDDERDKCPDEGDAFLDLTGDGCVEDVLLARVIRFQPDYGRRRDGRMAWGQVLELIVKTEAGHQRRLHCEPKCPKARVVTKGDRRLTITFGGQRFGVGQRIELRLFKPGTVGSYIRLKLGRERWDRRHCLIASKNGRPRECSD